jgi:hypothetical protein
MNLGVTYCQRQTYFISPIFFRLQLGFSPTLVETEVFNQFNQFNVINCYGVDASFYSRITDSDVKVRAGRDGGGTRWRHKAICISFPKWAFPLNLLPLICASDVVRGWSRHWCHNCNRCLRVRVQDGSVHVLTCDGPSKLPQLDFCRTQRVRNDRYLRHIFQSY